MTKRIVDYKIHTASCEIDMIQAIKRSLNEGWELHGELKVVGLGTSHLQKFFQAMIKYDGIVIDSDSTNLRPIKV